MGPQQQPPDGVVEAVHASSAHRNVTKQTQPRVHLVAGVGVEGDAHAGATVQHIHQLKKDPTRPNLRQVHLIHAELHDEFRAAGRVVEGGNMGENVTTRGVDLLGLPVGTRLALGPSAVVELTGLRTPCQQLNAFQPGLMQACLVRENGKSSCRAGVMSVVLEGGEVGPGDKIAVHLPEGPHEPLKMLT